MLRLTAAALTAVGLTLAAVAYAANPPDHFYSPSGNIECRFHQTNGGWLNCITFNNHRIAQLDRHGTLAAFDGFLSNGPFAAGHSPVVAYGAHWSNGLFTCSSASTGMTCTAKSTGRGFTISRTAITRHPAPAPSSRSAATYQAPATRQCLISRFGPQGFHVETITKSWQDPPLDKYYAPYPANVDLFIDPGPTPGWHSERLYFYDTAHKAQAVYAASDRWFHGTTSYEQVRRNVLLDWSAWGTDPPTPIPHQFVSDVIGCLR